jgi:hypothetical protein
MIKQYIKKIIYSTIIMTTGIGVPVIYHTKKYEREKD